MEPQKYDEIIRPPIHMAPHETPSTANLCEFHRPLVEISQHINPILARVATFLALSFHQDANGHET